MKPPVPENEQRRVEQLRAYRVMDTPREQGFDDLVLLASRLFEVPIALVTLIGEERQWFKASVGFEESETRRDEAFCAYAINAPRHVMVVEDTQQDPRFRGHRAVVGEPWLRFYAGAPLVTPEGDALGTLCVLDTRPRTFSNSEQEALKALARQAISQMQLRQVAEEQQRIAKRLQTLHDLAPVGMVRERLSDGRLLEANPEMLRMTGYRENEFLAMTDWDITPAEFVDTQLQQLENLRKLGRFGPFEKEYLCRGGGRLQVLLNGVLVRSPEGEPEIWSSNPSLEACGAAGTDEARCWSVYCTWRMIRISRRWHSSPWRSLAVIGFTFAAPSSRHWAKPRASGHSCCWT
ncbi:MAG: GAF domain-containing protein [Ectothiorhodospiraceae bacterium]|nr:GAF domain-containing protein [Ectothiorhodospiraceae bacterium]MCH8502702.1 GAF domain-containing protein [Ectothiorhodospiraceae bacterium]